MKLQRSKMASDDAEVSGRCMPPVEVPEGGGKAVRTSRSGGKKHVKVPKKKGSGGTSKANRSTGDVTAVTIKQEGIDKVETQRNIRHFCQVKGHNPKEAIEVDNGGLTASNDGTVNVENMAETNYDENGANRDEKELFQTIDEIKNSNNHISKRKKNKRGKSPSIRTRSKSKEPKQKNKVVTVTQVTEEDPIQGNEGRENNQRGGKELLGEGKNELDTEKIDLDMEEMQQDSLRKRKIVEDDKDTEETSKGSVEEINEFVLEDILSSVEGSFDEKDWNEEEEENGNSMGQPDGEDQEWSNVANTDSNSKETRKEDERNQSTDKKREILSRENGTDKEQGDTFPESEEGYSQSGRDGIGQDTGSILRGRGRRAVEEKKEF